MPVFKESKYRGFWTSAKCNANERTFETFAAGASPSKELIQQHRIHSDIPSGIVRPRPGPPTPAGAACPTLPCQQSLPNTLNVLLSNTLL